MVSYLAVDLTGGGRDVSSQEMLEVLANTLTLGMHIRKGSPSSSIILVYEQWAGVTRNKKTPQREEL